MTRSVLFVCLGNICRSPLAEAAFRAEAERLGLDVEVDSAGTGDWHLGHPPDPRAAAVAKRQGVDIDHLRARQVSRRFRRFDHIVALDSQQSARPRGASAGGRQGRAVAAARPCRGREGQAVADPYYGGDAAFRRRLGGCGRRRARARAKKAAPNKRMTAFAAAGRRADRSRRGRLERLAGGDLSEVLLVRRPDGRCTVAKGGPSVAPRRRCCARSPSRRGAGADGRGRA
jgi:protein-tyrosine phosphatase